MAIMNQVRITTTIRIDADLFDQVKEAAWLDRQSINSWMIAALKERIDKTNVAGALPNA